MDRSVDGEQGRWIHKCSTTTSRALEGLSGKYMHAHRYGLDV